MHYFSALFWLCWLSASEIRILLTDSQHKLYEKYLLHGIQYLTPDDGQ